jgi:hypothetical protein
MNPGELISGCKINGLAMNPGELISGCKINGPAMKVRHQNVSLCKLIMSETPECQPL